MYREKTGEHDDQLMNVDVHLEKGLILSSSADRLVKVWNMKKELIREIKFNEDITQALFLNHKGDIVTAHGG